MTSPGNAAKLRQRPRTIRYALIWIVVACIVPAWLGFAALIVGIYQVERERITQDAGMTARALMLAVDSDLAAARSALEVLASSTKLANDDFASFQQKATEAIVDLPLNNVVLRDRTGRQLVNTLVPYGTALPVHDVRRELELVFETGKPALSDLFHGPVANKPLVSIDVPVFRDGRVVYDLAAGVFSERLNELLARQHLPANWTAAIFDSTGIVMARSRDPQRYLGAKGSPPLLDAIARGRDGLVKTTTQDGIPVYAAFNRSAVSHWSVVIGVPASLVRRDIYAVLAVSMLGAMALLGIGIGLARRQSRKITDAVRSLVRSAAAFGHPGEAAAPATNIVEIDEVARGLEVALEIFQRRTQERDRAERDKELAERATKLKDEFIATVSHELRTPLTAINASLALLEDTDDENLSAETREMISIARDNSRRLHRLVNDILDIEKLEAGKVAFKFQTVEVEALLRQEMEAHRSLASSRGVQLRLQSSDRFYVDADPDRLRQVIANYLSNAIKFSPRGEEVLLSAERSVAGVRLAVRDHGPGIPADFRPHLFEKFAQADMSDAKQKGGSGLGLSIVREIIRRLGGEAGFADAPGVGTIFFVDLPRIEGGPRTPGGEPAEKMLLTGQAEFV